MAVCKLCLKDKQLIKRSHILPEFMYGRLYDETHKFFKFSPNQRAKGEGYTQRPSSGEYEGGLLCSTCENEVLSQYELYAKKAIYGGELPENESPVVDNCFSDSIDPP